MSVTLAKAPTSARESEGLVILAPFPPAGSYQAKPVEFSVEQVTDATTPGVVYLHGEFLDSIGGHDSIRVNGGRAVTVVR